VYFVTILYILWSFGIFFPVAPRKIWQPRQRAIIQGDKIGRIFANCAIVFLGQFFDNYGNDGKGEHER
jgi:hypothetical protein